MQLFTSHRFLKPHFKLPSGGVFNLYLRTNLFLLQGKTAVISVTNDSEETSVLVSVKINFQPLREEIVTLKFVGRVGIKGRTKDASDANQVKELSS